MKKVRHQVLKTLGMSAGNFRPLRGQFLKTTDIVNLTSVRTWSFVGLYGVKELVRNR